MTNIVSSLNLSSDYPYTFCDTPATSGSTTEFDSSLNSVFVTPLEYDIGDNPEEPYAIPQLLTQRSYQDLASIQSSPELSANEGLDGSEEVSGSKPLVRNEGPGGGKELSGSEESSSSEGSNLLPYVCSYAKCGKSFKKRFQLRYGL
jgi:hypothetical protein